MSEWSHDGHPIQAGTNRGDYALVGQRAHFSIMDLREMVVVARFYVDDPRNRSKRFVEYTCRDIYTSELYPYCRQLSQMSGVDDGDDNTLRPSTSFLPGIPGGHVKEQSPALQVDGDQVLVGFISGSRSRPVIVGVFRHSGSQYGATEAQGERRLTQHKGTRIEIQSDGSYIITSIGGATFTLSTDGGVRSESSGGASAMLLPDGSVQVIPAAGKTIQLGDAGLTPLDGVVTGRGVDSFTGSPYAVLGSASSVVLVKKDP